MADYYALLGVSPSASVEEIRSAYRKSALLFHPDRNPGDGEAAQKFCKLSRAYDILSDESQRQTYDEAVKKRKPATLLDSLSADLESALAIFGEVASFFEVPQPKKRSECTTCGGTGEAPLDLGLLMITRSCPDCEEEKPSTVAGDRP